MAGIYVHIPFCRQKCHYCNFFSIASEKYRSPFFEALAEEIFGRRSYLDGQPVGTIYLGGGTPSLADGSVIAGIINSIKAYYPVTDDAEITIEVNPDDVTPGLLTVYKEAGINRISLGIQSFFDNDLIYLNRGHSAGQSMKCIELVQQAGFKNISIDLIYGIPTLSAAQWEQNLETAFRLGIPHISAYSLTVEPKTGLDVLIRKQKLPAPTDDQSIEHFRILQEKMKEHHYEHYEISNFCRDGLYSVHNSNYWKDVHYLGLGPSAHSYNGISRQWNIGSVIQYIQMIQKSERQFEIEYLTADQKFNEYIMVSLRTQWGCDLDKIRQTFGLEREQDCLTRAGRYLLSGEMGKKENILYLTDKGKLFADAISSSFFVIGQSNKKNFDEERFRH